MERNKFGYNINVFPKVEHVNKDLRLVIFETEISSLNLVDLQQGFFMGCRKK